MNLNEGNYRQYDLDWFFVAGDKLCHAASAGGNLPGLFISVLDKYLSIVQIIANMSSAFQVETNPFVTELLNGEDNEIGMRMYLTTFKGMASKGFYSFDRKNLRNPESNEYVLVASPVVSDEQFDEYQIRISLLKGILPQADELPLDCDDINLIDHINLNSLNNL